LSGATETHNAGKAAFQDVDAISLLTPHAKLAVRPPSADVIPKFIKDAYRAAYFGRPGPAFVDLPANLILGKYDIGRQKLLPLSEAPISVPPENKLRDVVNALKNAKAPLVVLGKGAAYARAEGPIRALIERYGFLGRLGGFCFSLTHDTQNSHTFRAYTHG
jgi:2-hydroxyacyl-CoA lyase 1